MPAQWLKNIIRKTGFNITRFPKGSETLDAHLLQIFNLLQINCVFDVGANEGQYGEFLREIGYKGRIVSFEPVAKNFERLEKVASGDKDWLCYHHALGSTNNTVPLNVTSTTLFSSLLKPNDQLDKVFGGGGDIIAQEDVSMVTLNDIYSQAVYGIEKPHVYLKMDTQGYDTQVLAGANEVLSHIYALESEVSVKPIYEGMVSYHEAVANIEISGFSVTGFFPVTRDQLFQVIEFTCVAIHMDLLKPLVQRKGNIRFYD